MMVSLHRAMRACADIQIRVRQTKPVSRKATWFNERSECLRSTAQSLCIYAQALSNAEYDSIRETGQFVCLNMGGKYFWGARASGWKFSEQAAGKAGAPIADRVVRVDVSDDLFARFEHLGDNWDRIGAAWFAPEEALADVRVTVIGDTMTAEIA